MGTAGLRGPGRNMPHSAHTTAVNIPGFDLMFYTEKNRSKRDAKRYVSALVCSVSRAVRPPEKLTARSEV